MKVDPNQPIEYETEFVLCENGQVLLHTEEATLQSQLNSTSNAFKEFCQSLDPNKCYISAIIPYDVDKDVFFTAREVANEIGIHMQATVDTQANLLAQWEAYKKSKQYANA